MALSSISFALLLCLVLSTPFVEMSGLLGQEQRAYRLYGYCFVGFLQIVLLPLRGWEQSLRIVKTPVTLFFLWCVFSLAWTQHLDLTVKRLVLLGLVYGGTFAGLCDLGTQRSLAIVRTLLIGALVLNFVAAIALPEIGTHTVDGLHLWRGVMAHKNIAGTLCVVTVILFVFDCKKIPAAVRLATILSTLPFLYLAWSKTALMSMPLALAAGSATLIIARHPSFLEIWRRHVIRWALGFYGLLILGLILATLQQDILLSLTENTVQLTGRVAIWRPMIQFYLDHPILGSGYGAYWDASANFVDTHGRDAGIWRVIDQGHNGYLDLLVQVGLPGLALALYVACVRPIGPLVTMISQNPQRAGLIIALLTFLIIQNFSESSLFADDTLGNIFLFFALACIHRFVLHSSKNSTFHGMRGLTAAQLRESRRKRLRSTRT